MECRICGLTEARVYKNGYCIHCNRAKNRDHIYGHGAGAWARERELLNGGACDLCGVVPQESLQLDHDHATGAWRGLVCRKCNYLIAAIEQSEEHRDRVLAYLGE